MKNIIGKTGALLLSTVAIFFLVPTSLMAVKPAKVEKPAAVDAVLKKTGQTISYDVNGDKVDDSTLKDDGFYQKGVPASFTRSDTDVTVIDDVTGLVWQDNYEANSNNLAWNDAKDYCTGLGLDGRSWRLPNVDELLSIADKSRSRADHPLTYSYYDDAFQFIATTVSENVYITATEYAKYPVTGGTKEIWGVRFEDGRDYLTFKHENYQRFTRCVSGTEASAGKKSKRDKQGIVTDENTQLQWQDDGAALDVAWEAAIGYCEGLDLGGNTDWRLPNLNELYSIVDRTIADLDTPAVDPAFENVNGTSSADVYWSSSTAIEYKEKAWVLRFSEGTDSTRAKIDTSVTSHVMCVRDNI